jgi:hypothetical protein
MKMEEEISSETFENMYFSTLQYIPKDSNLQETTDMPLSVCIINVHFVRV